MASIELKAEKREQFGRALTALRVKGFIPAELYGHGLANSHLAILKKEFIKVFKKAGESTMIDLIVGDKKHPVMIHDVTVHPLSDEIMSIDFYQVRLDEKIQIKVPVVYVGESVAVKEKQGVLVKAMNEIKVEALPADIPRTIEVNLALLTDIGVDVHISDLKLPSSIRVLEDPAFVIATVTARMTEEEEAKLSAAADVGEIKTEGEEKKAEREAKAGETVEAAGDTAPAAAGKPAVSVTKK
ncbi:MAG: 50S ribosomal protein L25 [bacterium]|nr:50S ribosomal protein L25 [bacterium]